MIIRAYIVKDVIVPEDLVLLIALVTQTPEQPTVLVSRKLINMPFNLHVDVVVKQPVRPKIAFGQHFKCPQQLLSGKQRDEHRQDGNNPLKEDVVTPGKRDVGLAFGVQELAVVEVQEVGHLPGVELVKNSQDVNGAQQPHLLVRPDQFMHDKRHLYELLGSHAADLIFEVRHGTLHDGVCHPVEPLWRLARAKLMQPAKELACGKVLVVVQV